MSNIICAAPVTLGGEGARFAMLLQHDDAEREFAYDRRSASRRLDRGLKEAENGGWMIVSMKNDWNKVFPFQNMRGQT